ncbi:hypothetical protein UFOVP191_28 [uncultured Caudovirales phage]|uniref:Uncharacterized protein n=1 Tax=uncultured Caudovirales phage TaxID=2100421 RepID=A0A6J7WJG9_9CAUD|nr:hypothetical protein UFOVP191_28 [uncultured Caudovirales phage]
MRYAQRFDNRIVLNRGIVFKNHSRDNMRFRACHIFLISNKTLQRVIGFVWERLCW